MGDRDVRAEAPQLAADVPVTAGVPHRSLGRCLRGMRQEAGLSIEVAARAIGRRVRVRRNRQALIIRDYKPLAAQKSCGPRGNLRGRNGENVSSGGEMR
ncbi:hypothetical protein CJ469_05481 [Nocardia farcinica]|nr:hypothetical protein CJ469_06200 [Nocardia farcinica]PFW99218.1 hypothetical protein CJ469_05481 [Nocardia farcinica]